jgi:hypothetical protein
MTTNSARVAPRPGLLSRLKLAEPVRLYAYSLLTAILAALVLAGTVTDNWYAALSGIAAAILAVVPGAEATRASVYSPATHMADLVAVTTPRPSPVLRTGVDVADALRAARL